MMVAVAMRSAPFAHLQAKRRDFAAVHIHTPRIGIAIGLNAPLAQHLHHSSFKQSDQLSDIDIRPTQIVEDVGDPLTGAVIGHLATTIDLNNGHITGVEHVLRLARQTLCVHRRVLE